MVAVINELSNSFTVNSPNVRYTSEYITSKYGYQKTVVTKQPNGQLIAEPTEVGFEFQVERKVGKTGYILYFWIKEDCVLIGSP